MDVLSQRLRRYYNSGQCMNFKNDWNNSNLEYRKPHRAAI